MSGFFFVIVVFLRPDWPLCRRPRTDFRCWLKGLPALPDSPETRIKAIRAREQAEEEVWWKKETCCRVLNLCSSWILPSIWTHWWARAPMFTCKADASMPNLCRLMAEQQHKAVKMPRGKLFISSLFKACKCRQKCNRTFPAGMRTWSALWKRVLFIQIAYDLTCACGILESRVSSEIYFGSFRASLYIRNLNCLKNERTLTFTVPVAGHQQRFAWLVIQPY